MNLRQAAEMALKALENMSPDTDTLVEVEPHVWEYRGSLVIQALRQALAQPDEVLAEREACAKIVEADGLARGDEGLVLIKAAGRIRATGEK
jgi:regulator of protease activity HflC (stomatin/prohibitin superfamily)